MYQERYKSHHDANRVLKQAFSSKESAYEYLKETLNQEANNRRVLYLHVPYCKKICSFCPFSKFSKVPTSGYDDYLISDMNRIINYTYIKDKSFEAINFGGGTPTALSPKQFDRILKHINNSFLLEADAEISVESSITELTDEMLEVLVSNNVNRLSIGVQTFNDNGRKLLNRRGSGEFAYNRLKKIRKAIPNTNIDLIYNYPGEDENVLKEDIEVIRSLDLAGISFYSLMIHEKTPLAKSITELELKQMNDLTREKRFFNEIINGLKQDGYEMFELTKLINNKRDRYRYIEVKHDNGDCIPIGVKAGGSIGRYLHFNPEDREDFDEAIRISNRGRMVTNDYFKINRIINELQHGLISYKTLESVDEIHRNQSFLHLLDELEKDGLIIKEKDTIRFTNEGYFFGNNIIHDIAKTFINNI